MGCNPPGLRPARPAAIGHGSLGGGLCARVIDLEGRSVELLPNQGFVVPKGVMHCTRAPEKSVILMVETATVVPTGDA